MIKKSCNLTGWEAQLATHNQVVISDATLPSWTYPWERVMTFDSFLRYWRSKNSAIWLDEKNNWALSIKSSTVRYYLPLMVNFMQENLKYNSYLPRDTDDKRIMQSGWTRSTNGHTKLKVVVSDPTLPWWLTPCRKS